MKKNKSLKYCIICSGGNAPGMSNAVVAFTKKCLASGIEPFYSLFGFKGLVENQFFKCDPIAFQEYINKGSAIIGSSRYPEFAKDAKLRAKAVDNLKQHGFDALVVLGGEGSYKGALELSKLGINVLAIPATIDNDVASTNYTIGFDSSLNQISKHINDICDCFASHAGIALVEVMGRNCPDLAVSTAIGSNIHYVVTKYSKLDLKGFIDVITNAKKHGKRRITIVITEHLYPSEGPQSLPAIAKAIEKQTGLFTRHAVVGYIQRGGASSARDRLLANYLVDVGIDNLLKGKKNIAVGRINKQTVCFPLAKALKMERKTNNQTLVKKFNEINQF